MAALREWTGNNAIRFVTVRQVHGDAVQLADSAGSSGSLGMADALITQIFDVALMVRTADCLPIFLQDAVTGAVGLIHAGWRSTELHIAEKTVAAMQKNFGTEPRNLQAGFGPAIRTCCYEVGREFQSKFPDGVDQRQDNFFLDLIRVNRSQLIRSGVGEDRITDCGLCTACDSQFFSYRRDGAAAGRHLSLICRCSGATN